MLWAVTFQMMLEAAGGRVIYKISVKTDNVMNGGTVEIIKIIVIHTELDDATDTWRAVLHYLGHGREHMLTILPTIWRPGYEKHMHVKGTWFVNDLVFIWNSVSGKWLIE